MLANWLAKYLNHKVRKPVARRAHPVSARSAGELRFAEIIPTGSCERAAAAS